MRHGRVGRLETAPESPIAPQQLIGGSVCLVELESSEEL